MSVYRCDSCGSKASTLARCPGCGTASREFDNVGPSSGTSGKIAPWLLGVFGLCLSVPAGIQGIYAYNVRVAQERIESDRVLQAERAKQEEEERRILIVRADSILKSIPRSQIRKLTREQLDSDVAALQQRSDPVARRWLNAAAIELKTRSANHRSARSTR
jgi:hypothetical protein